MEQNKKSQPMLLLSLLGEQPIPNLLPLWQYAQYDSVRFAATTRTYPLALSLAAAIPQDPRLAHLQVLDPLLLEAYNLATARRAINQALVDHHREGKQVCLNLTGGTKLMSLAALQAAFGSGTPLLYVATESNEVIHLSPDGSELRRDPLEVHISVNQYLLAHELQSSYDSAFRPGMEKAPVHHSQPGSYLEEQVARAALKEGVFDDVRRGLYIRRQVDHGYVVNELDVVVTRNGRLAVCSCKSGSATTPKMREWIYELYSLSSREAAGIYCGKVLVVDQPEIPPAIIQRAQGMHVRLVYGQELDKISHHLLKATQ